MEVFILKIMLNVLEKEYPKDVLDKLKEENKEIKELYLDNKSVLHIKTKKKYVSEVLQKIATATKNKENETHYLNKVNLDNPFYIVRVDGICFSKISKLFPTALDKVFSDVMVETAHNVAEKLQNLIFYTVHSDEISFYFNNKKGLKTSYLFGKKEVKILSRISSLTSVMFYKALTESELDNHTKKKVLNAYVGFDSKLFTFNEQIELYNYFKERQTDCYRNFASVFYRKELQKSQKEIQGISLKKLIEIAIEKYPDKWYSFSDDFKFGKFFIHKHTHAVSKENINSELFEDLFPIAEYFDEEYMKEDIDW